MGKNKSKSRILARPLAFVLCLTMLITSMTNMSVLALDSDNVRSNIASDEIADQKSDTTSDDAIDDDKVKNENDDIDVDTKNEEDTPEKNGNDQNKDKNVVKPKSKVMTKGIDDNIVVQSGDFDQTYLNRFTLNDAHDTITYFNPSGYSSTEIIIPEVIHADGTTITAISNNVFSNLSLEKVVMPETIESIGNNAFKTNPNLGEINWSTSLKTIGNGAFYSSGVIDVDLRNCNNLTDIGQEAFMLCADLISVDLPDSLIKLDYATFRASSKLESVVIGDSLEIIGPRSFSDCPALNDITLPNSLKQIGESAFSSCENLINIVLPSGLTTIGGNAFADTKSLAGIIEIPSGVKNIGANCFRGASLSNITLNEGLESIGGNAFYSAFADSVTDRSIKIPSTVKTIGADAFYDLKNSTIDLSDHYVGTVSGSPWGTQNSTKIIWKSDDDTCFWLGENNYIYGLKHEGHTGCQHPELHNTSNVELVIPSMASINGNNVSISGIATNAFKNNTALKKVTFEEGSLVQSIDNGAFMGCSNITEINFPDTLKSIGEESFSNCYRIDNILLPDSVETIGKSAFKWCSGIKNIKLSNSLKTLAIDTFYSCSRLTSITIPDSVITIEPSAFNSCSNLKDVVIGNGVESIGNEVFRNCSNIEIVQFGENLKSLMSSTFYGCRSLKEITIPATVENIGSSCFNDCTQLTKVTILGDGELVIGNSFPDSAKLETINLPEREKDSIIGSPWNAKYADIVWKNHTESAVYITEYPWLFDRTTKSLVKYTGNKGDNVDLVIPSGITHAGVYYEIENMNVSFEYNTFKSLKFEEGIKGICEKAFTNAKFVDTNIVLPDSLIEIGQSAFLNVGITEVNLPPNLINMGKYAFANNKLKEITIPSGLSIIPESAFMNNELESLILSEGIQTIDRSAFRYNLLASVDLPDTLKNIEVRGFSDNKLTEIIIPDSGISIGNNVFENNLLKGEIIIPKTVTRLGSNVFISNPDIEKLYINYIRGEQPSSYSHPYGIEGVAANSKVIYKGEVPDFSVTEIGKNNRERIITTHAIMEDPRCNIVKYEWTDASGNTVYENLIGGQSNISDITADAFTVTQNGIYTVKITTINTSFLYTMEIDDIGIMTIDAEDVVIPRTSTGSLTENQLIDWTSKHAVDLDSRDSGNHSKITYKLNPGDFTEIQKLKNHGDNYDATMSAEYAYDISTTNRTATPTSFNIRLAGVFIDYHTNGGKFDDDSTTKQAFKLTPGALENSDMPSEPTKHTFNFMGWYTTSAAVGGTKIDIGSDINSDTVLYARWAKDIKTVTFDTGDHGKFYGESTTTERSIDSGNSLDSNMPPTPTSESHGFVKWVISGGALDGTEFKPDTQISDNLTVQAVWKLNEYTVNFIENKDSGDSTVCSSVKVKHGNKVDALVSSPLNKGYKFAGWYTSKVAYDPSSSKYDFTKPITGNTNIYAGWKTHSYKVTFDADGGKFSDNTKKKILNVKSPYSTVSSLPNTPDRDGHRFDGWQIGKSKNGSKFNVSTEVNKDITVYANWSIKYFTLSFDLNGVKGRSPAPQTLAFGKSAKQVSDPENAEYKFEGWNTKKDGSGTKWNFSKSKMPANNLVIYAQWELGGAQDKNEKTKSTETKHDNVTGGNTGNNGGNNSSIGSANASGNKIGYESDNNRPQTSPSINDDSKRVVGSNSVEVPLQGQDDTWALVNMILTIAACVMAAFVIALAIYRRARQLEFENSIKLKWVVTIASLSILCLILFVLTQDMSGVMVITDRWTLFVGLLLAFETLASVIAFKNTRDEQESNSYTVNN